MGIRSGIHSEWIGTIKPFFIRIWTDVGFYLIGIGYWIWLNLTLSTALIKNNFLKIPLKTILLLPQWSCCDFNIFLDAGGDVAVGVVLGVIWKHFKKFPWNFPKLVHLLNYRNGYNKVKLCIITTGTSNVLWEVNLTKWYFGTWPSGYILKITNISFKWLRLGTVTSESINNNL